jgi:hypothetical protein
VDKGIGLKDVQKIGKQDPYVTFALGDGAVVGQSKVHAGGTYCQIHPW